MGSTLRTDGETAEEEERRLRALDRTRLVTSIGYEDLFERYVRLASTLLDLPISMVSLIDHDRQWFKARKGVDFADTPREYAFCDYTIRQSDVFEVPDMTADPRFADNPFVTGEEHVRFYAGAPILVDDDLAIGTLCVLGREPRRLTDRERAALADLAAILSREIETNHLAEARADRAAAARAAAVEIEHQMRNMFSKVGALIEMTAKETLPGREMVDTARRRIAALSQASEVCLQHGFGATPVSLLANAALAPSSNRAGLSVTLEGAAAWLTPAAASVLAPLIDELAHDAGERGAGGTNIVFSWRRQQEEFVLSWRESNAAAADEPFSTAYLREIAPTALHGRVDIEKGPGGPSYEITLPARLVLSD